MVRLAAKGRYDKLDPVRHHPPMKWTSRLSRSSFATKTAARRFRATVTAAANWGRFSRASLPAPLSASVNHSSIAIPSRSAKSLMAARWASRPSPDLLYSLERRRPRQASNVFRTFSS